MVTHDRTFTQSSYVLKIEKCLGIYPRVEQRTTKRPPHKKQTQLIHLKHWTPLDQKPSKSIKIFPPQFIEWIPTKKQASNKARAYFIWLYAPRVKVVVLNYVI
jgi:hypothetical protein